MAASFIDNTSIWYTRYAMITTGPIQNAALYVAGNYCLCCRSVYRTIGYTSSAYNIESVHAFPRYIVKTFDMTRDWRPLTRIEALIFSLNHPKSWWSSSCKWHVRNINIPPCKGTVKTNVTQVGIAGQRLIIELIQAYACIKVGIIKI